MFVCVCILACKSFWSIQYYFTFRMYPNIYFNYIFKLGLCVETSIYSYIISFVPLFLYILFENKNSVVLLLHIFYEK